MFKHLTLFLCAGTLFAGCVITSDDTSDDSNTNTTPPNTDTGNTGGTGTTAVDPTSGGGTDTGTDTSGVTLTTTDATTDSPTTAVTTTETLTTTEGTTDNTTGPVELGCGWNARGNFYACAQDGGVPNLEDPDGISPIACDPGLVAGEKCSDEEGPVDGVGCCTPEGVLYFCDVEGDSTIFEQDCNA